MQSPLPAPLPEVPSADSGQSVATATSAVRMAMILIVFAAALNVAREAMYAIGAVQSYGTLGPRELRGMAQSLTFFVIAFVIAGGLKRMEKWAWWAALIWCGLDAVKIGWELLQLWRWRERGYHEADLQVCIFIILLGILVAAMLYLLSKNGRVLLQEKR